MTKHYGEGKWENLLDLLLCKNNEIKVLKLSDREVDSYIKLFYIMEYILNIEKRIKDK